MFTVKATYRAETRKFVFSNSADFPTYQALQDQLYRVFPISHNVYLSRVLFSPSGDSSGRILLMLEAHSEREYEEHVQPYRGKQWPGAVLRFAVFDETPHKLPSIAAASESPVVDSGVSSERAEDETTVLGTGITGPVTPFDRMRSLLEDNFALREARRRTLPPPPVPRRYPNAAQTSPWRWLPPPAPVPRVPSPPFPEVRVQAPTPGPTLPPPPPLPPMPNRLRPMASMPSMPFGPLPPPDPSSFFSPLGPPPPPPPPPVPPPRPLMYSPNYSHWRSPVPLPPPPPPLPTKPFERRRGSRRDMIERISAASSARALRTDLEDRASPAHPMNANRHSWAAGDGDVGGRSPAAIVTDIEQRRDDISKRLRDARERARILADERRRKTATLPNAWARRDKAPIDLDSSSDDEKENVIEAATKIDKGKGKAKPPPVQLETITDSEDDLFRPTYQIPELYAPRYSSPFPEKKKASPSPAATTSTSKVFTPVPPSSSKAAVDEASRTPLLPSPPKSFDWNYPVGPWGPSPDSWHTSSNSKEAPSKERHSPSDWRDPSSLWGGNSDPWKWPISAEDSWPAPHIWGAPYDNWGCGMRTTPAQDLLDACKGCDGECLRKASKSSEPAVDQDVKDAQAAIDKAKDAVDTFFGDMKAFVEKVQNGRPSQPPSSDATSVPISVPAPAVRPFEDAPMVIDEAVPATTEESSPPPPKPVHRGVRCDACDETIEGVRHKCLDCPDYDLCTPCLTRTRVNKPSTIPFDEVRAVSGHQDNHMFFAIDEPGDLWLAATFKGPDARAPSVPTTSAVHTTGVAVAQPSSAPATEPARAVQHYATCDLCDSSIVNKRFKCLQCPDWDVCEDCFSIVGEQHPGHGFVQITDPVALQQYHQVRSIRRPRHYARCDECGSSIVGVRYKCMHPDCSDYDLCDKCEALPIPVHPSTHPMLKVRAPDTLIPKVKRRGDPEPAEHLPPAPRMPATPPTPVAVPLGPPLSPPIPPVALSARPPTPYTSASQFESPYGTPPSLPRMPSPPSFLPTAAINVPEDRYPFKPIVEAAMPGGLWNLSPPPMSQPILPTFSSPSHHFVTMPASSPVVSASTRSTSPASKAAPLAAEVQEGDSLNGVLAGDFDDALFGNTRPPFCPYRPLSSTHFGQGYMPAYTMPMQQVASPASSRSASPVSPLPMPATIPRFYPEPDSAPVSSNASPEVHHHSLPEQEQAPLIDLTESRGERLIDLTHSSSEEPSQTPSRNEPQVARPESRQTEREMVASLLPQVPPTDLHELFDLAAQFRHLWTQNSSGAPSARAKSNSPSKAATEEVASNDSPPTELASSQSEASVEAEAIPAPIVQEPTEPAQSPLSTVELLDPPRRPLARSSVFSTLSEMLRGPPQPSNSSVTDGTGSRPISFITDDTSTIVGGAVSDMLRAAYVADNNIPDGQIFPPGAEFVKSWAMRNDGTVSWPESTQLVFVAGNRLQIDSERGDRFKVGTVHPGEIVDVWTGELKAPDVPGKYISYWRLSDGEGNRFGHSIWVDITVMEPPSSTTGDSESSLSASSIIMPQPPSAASQSQPAQPDEDDNDGSSSSSVSFIDVPSDEDDVFEDSRSHVSPTAPVTRSPDVEYVVLDDSSDEEL